MKAVDIRSWLKDNGYMLVHLNGELEVAGPTLLQSAIFREVDDRAMIALREARKAWTTAERQWWISYALLPFVLAGAMWNGWVMSHVVRSYVAWFTDYQITGEGGAWGMCLLFVFAFNRPSTHSLSDRPMGWWPSFWQSVAHVQLSTLAWLTIWLLGLLIAAWAS